MMSDHRPPDIGDDDVRRMFNDLARVELTTVARPPCECNCTGDEPHATFKCHVIEPGGPRRRTATVLVALHMWAFCDTDPTTVPGGVNIDDRGNLCAYMCGPCADHAEAVARRKVADMLASGHPPRCPTCGRRVAVGADIFERRPV